jgi:hypothetical protein
MFDWLLKLVSKSGNELPPHNNAVPLVKPPGKAVVLQAYVPTSARENAHIPEPSFLRQKIIENASTVAVPRKDVEPVLAVQATFLKAGSIARRVEHPIAYYFDENGQPHVIRYDALQNVEEFLRARNQNLFADLGRTLRLQVRNGKSREDGSEYGIPHFWAPKGFKIARSTEGKIDPAQERKENDPAHEVRIDRIVQSANAVKPKRIITYDFWAFREKIQSGEISQNAEPTTLVGVNHNVLANVDGYTWRRYTKKYSLNNGDVIPDIVGWVTGQKATEEKPAVFIEVVKTNYPSEKKWQAYREATASNPLIVIFDFLENYHFEPRRADPKAGRGQADIRVIYYMWKGAVWKNLRQLDAENPSYSVASFKGRVTKDRRRRDNANNLAPS